VTGRMDITLPDQRAVQNKRKVMQDKLEVALVVSQPLSEVSEGTQGGVWEHKVEPFPKPSHSTNHTEAISTSKFPTVGAIIEHFGGFSTCAVLGSDDLNSPRNAMMLAPVAHWMFDSFNLWLTPFKVGHLVPCFRPHKPTAATRLRKTENLCPMRTNSISPSATGTATGTAPIVTLRLSEPPRP